MIYYIIITMFIGFIWFCIGYKEFTYPIPTIIVGCLLGPICVPLRIILKLLK